MANNKIFIDDNLPSRSTGGAARYFRHIRDGFIDYFGEQAYFFSPQTYNYGSAHHIQALPTHFKGSERLGIFRINYFLSDRKARQLHPDIYYSPYFGNSNSTGAQVYTVYDRIYELFFQHTEEVNAFIAKKKACIEKAELLIAISQNTANDIVSIYPKVNPRKIAITWLGVDEFFFETRPQKENNYRPYFLYVGARKGYKNFNELVKAFGQSGLAKDFDLRVVSPSISGNFTKEERDLLVRYHLEQSIDLFLAISEVNLRESYSRALALLYPSEYEGFGLPILEAMAAGTLVATSNVASMPEISGNIAFYFDPHSADSISETLKEIVSITETERLSRINRGIYHARQFSWKRCQEQTVEAISRLLLM